MTSKQSKLYCTTIVLWSKSPTDAYSLQTLGRKVENGEIYCFSQECEEVSDPESLPEGEFFDE